jgi:hypothetical protein
MKILRKFLHEQVLVFLNHQNRRNNFHLNKKTEFSRFHFRINILKSDLCRTGIFTGVCFVFG